MLERAFLEHPACALFEPIVVERLLALGRFPLPHELSALGADIATARPRWFEFVEQISGEVEARGGFDHFIAEQRAIPTRPESSHDLLGALVWLHYPALKTAIHEIHVASSGPRGARENAATHFDESGVLVLSSEPAVFERLAGLHWVEAFWEQRAELLATTRFVGFGHGLLDSLREPHPRLMGKALFVRIGERDLLRSPSALRTFVDGAAAPRLAEFLVEPGRLLPLPVLGVPGWAPGQSVEKYRDASYFRTQRRDARPMPAPSFLDLSR